MPRSQKSARTFLSLWRLKTSKRPAPLQEQHEQHKDDGSYTEKIKDSLEKIRETGVDAKRKLSEKASEGLDDMSIGADLTSGTGSKESVKNDSDEPLTVKVQKGVHVAKEALKKVTEKFEK